MKIYILIIVFLVSSQLFSQLFSQVKLIENNKTELIGSFEKMDVDELHYSATLKSKIINDNSIYELILNNKCEATFHATMEELNLIYKTVLKDFKNPKDARTKFKLGKKILELNDGTYLSKMKSLLYNDNKKTESTLELKIDNCRILINLKEWNQLFGR
tara:strand:- start:72 stop:548 length:477 start_codon:yes stop_codon:yes gene_type:complete